MRHLTTGSLLLIALLLLPELPAFAQPNQEDEKPENLQVLPETMSMQQVRRIMFRFTDALGENCLYCHVGQPGQPDTFDWASDEKETKETARAMMRMVSAINDDHIYQLPDGEESIAVNCQTCHHGLAKPQLLEDLLTDHFSEHGVEETLVKYSDLRQEYYGGFSYNFQAGTLNVLAQRLLGQQEVEAAQSFLELNLSMYPNSSDAYALMAESEVMLENTEAAIMHLEKVLELDPENRRAKARLSQLKGEN